MTIIGRTEDRAWLSIKCGQYNNFEGWVLASEVDMTCDRKVYEHHDVLQHDNNEAHKEIESRTVKALRDIVLR